MTKDEMKSRISMVLKDPILQQGFEIICKENAELGKENEIFKKANRIIAQQRDGRDVDISLLENRIEELEAQIEKMKCCENCKYSSYWGDEVHCNYGLKEALVEDRLVECENMEKWEMKK